MSPCDLQTRTNNRKLYGNHGFTLIELLLVMVILAVLATIVVPRLTNRGKQASETAAVQQISSFETALDMFESDCGRLPTTEEGLQALVIQPPGITGWRGGPYLKKGIPNDPWGSPYLYRCPGQHNTSGYDIYSFGPDKQEGGGDDIDNWTQK